MTICKRYTVLIVADRFAPFNGISAIRPSKIAKFLCENHNCVVDVIRLNRPCKVVDERLQKDVSKVRKIYSLPLFQPKANGRLYKNILFRRLQSLFFTMREFFYQRKIYRNALKLMENHDFNQYDIVFTTFSPLFSHMMGRYIRKKNKNCIWVADYRDPPPNVIYTNALISSIEKRRIWKITRKADLITGVSEYCYKFLPKYKNKECMMLTNGYDKNDFNFHRDIPNKKFILTYTGTIYEGKQDLTPIFRVLNRLIAEENAEVEFHYAGMQFEEFFRQAQIYGLEKLVVNYGLICRKESLQLQKDSDVLLMGVWNEEKSKDILTGKVYEYMGSEVSTICTVAGNKQNSLVKNIFQETNIGYCHENSFDSEDKLYEYLRKQYVSYKLSGRTLWEGNQENIQKYQYEKIASKLYVKIVSIQNKKIEE